MRFGAILLMIVGLGLALTSNESVGWVCGGIIAIIGVTVLVWNKFEKRSLDRKCGGKQ